MLTGAYGLSPRAVPSKQLDITQDGNISHQSTRLNIDPAGPVWQRDRRPLGIRYARVFMRHLCSSGLALGLIMIYIIARSSKLRQCWKTHI